MSDAVMETARELAAGERTRASRPQYMFEVPPEIAKMTGITSVGMVELTAGEELMAAERARGSQFRLGLEVAKESLRSINGKPVNTGDGSIDVVWDSQREGMSYLRQLVLAAYTDIHNPKVEDLKAFLRSRTVRV